MCTSKCTTICTSERTRVRVYVRVDVRVDVRVNMIVIMSMSHVYSKFHFSLMMQVAFARHQVYPGRDVPIVSTWQPCQSPQSRHHSGKNHRATWP